MHLGTCYKYESTNASISCWVKTVCTTLARNRKTTRSYYHSAPPYLSKGMWDVARGCYQTVFPHLLGWTTSPSDSLPNASSMEEGTIFLAHERARALTLKLHMTVVQPSGPEAGNCGSSPCSWVTVCWLLATSYFAVLSLSFVICKMEITPPSTQDICRCTMRLHLKATVHWDH